MKIVVRGATVLGCLLSFATGAFAQATRTWVSGVGDDANPCSRTAPCKTFAGAISKTAPGGEIDALDPGGYGAVTITKSITIDGGSQVAGVLVSGANGIVISAAASDVVTLRRIQINGIGTGLNGVRILSAKQVNIDDVEIFGFTGSGVDVEPSAATNVNVTNSKMANNGGAGLYVGDFGKVAVTSCQLVGNTFAGVDAVGATSPPLVLVSNSTLSFNGRGIYTGNNATVRISHNDIFANTTFAWEIAGGQIVTHVDNRMQGAGSGTLTPVVY